MEKDLNFQSKPPYYERMSKFLVKTDKFLEKIPFASTFSSLIGFVAKQVFDSSPSLLSNTQHTHLFTHLHKKENARYVALLFPFVGNLSVFIYDIAKKRDLDFSSLKNKLTAVFTNINNSSSVEIEEKELEKLEALKKVAVVPDNFKNEIEGPYSAALKDLDALKIRFGASENSSRPKLKGEKFLGFSVDLLRASIHRRIINSTPGSKEHSFWGFLGKAFDVPANGMSKYEYISLSIQAIERVKVNKEKIIELLLDPSKGDIVKYFNQLTGLYIHAENNNGAVYLSVIDSLIHNFEISYQSAKEKGTLETFFDEAFDEHKGCFEARVRVLEDYSTKNNQAGLNLQEVPDYTESDTINFCLGEELRVYRAVQEISDEDMVSFSEFRQYLIEHRNILQTLKAVPAEGGDSRHPSEQELDQVLNDFVDDYLLE